MDLDGPRLRDYLKMHRRHEPKGDRWKARVAWLLWVVFCALGLILLFSRMGA